MATVYAVASAKGGVGKTTTTAAIATILADSGADVVAIDADIGMANLAETVGVTPGEITLHDVLAGEADPLDAVHEGPAGLRVVPGAADLDAYAAADPSLLGDVLSAFDDADYVFIDAGAGLSHDSTLPLGLADETLLVSTTERSALGDTEKTRQLTERLDGTVAGAAITRVRRDAAADDDGELDAVAELLDTRVLGRIPEDESVTRAAAAGEPLSLFAPDAPATRGYRDLTRALTGAEVAGDGLASGANSGGDDDATEGGERDDTAEASSDNAETDSTEQDEDIIVADSDRIGLGDPGDDEEIIVADESSVEAGDGTEEIDDGESESEAPTAPDDPGNGVTDETELVGEDHVNGDDLEAMIAEDDDGTAAFDDPDRVADDDDEAADDDDHGADDDDEAADDDDHGADDDDEDADDDGAARGSEAVGEDSEADDDVIADADEVASQTHESDSESTESGGESADIDDELAGSIPFRDDDTEPRNTVPAGDGATGDGSEDHEERSESGSGDGSDKSDENDDGNNESDDKKRGGFLSRLFGR